MPAKQKKSVPMAAKLAAAAVVGAGAYAYSPKAFATLVLLSMIGLFVRAVFSSTADVRS